MWNCVEDRVDEGHKFGRVMRKLIFEDIYADRNSVLARHPISRNTIPALKVRKNFIFKLYSRVYLVGRLSYRTIIGQIVVQLSNYWKNREHLQ